NHATHVGTIEARHRDVLLSHTEHIGLAPTAASSPISTKSRSRPISRGLGSTFRFAQTAEHRRYGQYHPRMRPAGCHLPPPPPWDDLHMLRPDEKEALRSFFRPTN